MKTATVTYRPKVQVPYPNAAAKGQLLHKVLDILLITASGMGIAAMLMFIAIL